MDAQFNQPIDTSKQPNECRPRQPHGLGRLGHPRYRGAQPAPTATTSRPRGLAPRRDQLRGGDVSLRGRRGGRGVLQPAAGL
jgi:hypothetical protein